MSTRAQPSWRPLRETRLGRALPPATALSLVLWACTAACRPPLLASPCESAADCPKGHSCEPAWQVCVPTGVRPPPPTDGCGTMSAVRDDFEQPDGLRGLSQLCPWGEDGVRVQQGVLLFTARSDANRTWPLCQSPFAASLREDSLSIELVQPPTLPGTRVYFGIQDTPSPQELWVEFALEDGQLALGASAAAGVVAGTPVTFDAERHHRWRLRESGGVLVAETSPGGDTWQTLASLPSPAFVQRAIPYLALSAAENTSDTIIVDNLNTDRPAGAWCPSSALRDEFAGEALDPAWKTYPGYTQACATGLQDGAAAITLRPGDSTSCELYHSGGWVLADSQVAVEIVQLPPVGFRLGFELWSARGDVARWALEGEQVVAEVRRQFGATLFDPPPTSAPGTRWLRLRQAGQVLAFELRSDGSADWTAVHSLTLAADIHLDPHSLALLLQHAGGVLPSEGVTVRLDNLNAP